MTFLENYFTMTIFSIICHHVSCTTPKSAKKREHLPYSQDIEIYTVLCHQHTSDTLLHTTVQWNLVAPQTAKMGYLPKHPELTLIGYILWNRTNQSSTLPDKPSSFFQLRKKNIMASCVKCNRDPKEPVLLYFDQSTSYFTWSRAVSALTTFKSRLLYFIKVIN